MAEVVWTSKGPPGKCRMGEEPLINRSHRLHAGSNYDQPPSRAELAFQLWGHDLKKKKLRGQI
jgi:hypothetical protein